MLSQLSAVTGRRIKPSYTDIINAQTPYLPTLMDLESRSEYEEKMYGLKSRELETLEKRDKMMREFEKDKAKRAKRLGWANIGLGGGLGLANILASSDFDLSSLLPDFSSNSATDMIGGVVEPSIGQTFGEDIALDTGVDILGNLYDTTIDTILDIGTGLF